MGKRILLVMFAALSSSLLLGADIPARWTGRCQRVVDGDTILVKRDREFVTVDLAGVDCPEIGQSHGAEAASFATRNLEGKIVTVIPESTSHSTVVARLEIFGNDFSEIIVSEGLAWCYPRAPADPMLVAAETQARIEGRGLWEDSNPTPPWIWRMGNRTQLSTFP
ncbi:MAG: hypothetical protein C3F08_00720 [Candidatus Methylomirabilota bacterium]|nr:MAG: hypothetical protein C3F08_00720 [candidate division NC10 bacterium]